MGKNAKIVLKKSARKMLEKWGFLGGSKPHTPKRVLKLQFCMLKERLMNPGSYFRFGWQRETERVEFASFGMSEAGLNVCFVCITKGMLDKREP